MKPYGCQSLMCSGAVLLALLCTSFSFQKRFKLQSLGSCLERRISKSCHYSTLSETDIADKLRALKDDRDLKRNEQYASNLAAQKAEIEYRDFRSLHYHVEGSPLTASTYDYGFNTQSNDAFLVKDSSLGGSVPSGIITLAVTNFKREFG